MSPPRVLFLTTSLPSPDDPVAGIFVLEHARAARKAGADIAILHLDRRRGVRTVRVRREDGEFPLWRATYPYRPTGLSIAAHAAAGIAGYRAARRDGFDPELLHAHFFLSALPAALLPRPFVASEHWSIFLPEDPAVLTPPLRLGARVALSRARVVLPVSQKLADEMHAVGIGTPFQVVPNAVDTSLFRPGPGGNGARLATVGVRAEKGVDVLLRAVATVRARRPDVTLDVIGDGPLRADYQRLAAELGFGGAVTFHGFLDKARIAAILGDSDLFVLASRFENNPCALVEAQAAGLPAVASSVGGVAEILQAGGALVPPSDEQALADAVMDVLGRLETFDREAIARSAEERYSMERVGRALVDVYERALYDGGAG
jgi:glycosyltransferase involved in cell wall biosynthesis